MAFNIVLLLSYVLVGLISAQGDISALSLRQCKVDDDACVTNIIKIFFPISLEPNDEIGAEEMDPMFIELIEGNLPILPFKVTNSTIKGMKTCEVQSAKFIDKNNAMVNMELLCQKLDIEAWYEAKGELLAFHVEGNGGLTVLVDKYRINLDLEFKTVAKDGKTHRSIKSFKFKTEPLGKVTYDPRNLFNGQKDLADAVIKFANENWKQVMLIVQDPLILAMTKKIVKNVNKYLKTIDN